MRRSLRERYPYFPGDLDPFINPLPRMGAHGGPPDANDVIAALQRFMSLIPGDVGNAPAPDLPTTPERSPRGEPSASLEPEPAALRRGMPSLEERPMPFHLEEKPEVGEDHLRLLSYRSPSASARPGDGFDPGLPGVDAEDGNEARTGWPFSEDTPLELINGLGGPPRLYIGRDGRPLTPAEQLRWSNYLHALERLREIDPRHPQLQSAYSPTWVPDNQAIADVAGAARAASAEPLYRAPEFDLHLGPLWREVAKVRRDLELQSLEWHHPLVTQLRKYFNDHGISEALREKLGYYMWMKEHRGVGGLHPYWNRDWDQFAGRYRDAKPEQIQEHLLELLRRYDQLRTP